MKLVYVHQYFLTPSQGGAVRSYYLAKGLVDAGVQVDMITAHNAPAYELKWVDGIRVHYLPVVYRNEFSKWRRAISFLRFVWAAKCLLAKMKRPDLLYITSTPLTTGILGLWAKRAMDLPYVFEVRDQWPEAPIQMGVLRGKLLKGLFYRLERLVYDESSHVVALSSPIRESILRVSPGKEVSCIPNFADTDFFKPKDGQWPLAEKKDEKRPLTVSYVGAIGRVNGLESFLNLAKAAQQTRKSWQFVLMGKGAYLPKLRDAVAHNGLENVVFLPFGNKAAVRELLGRSDFAYISFLPLPVLESSSPNKFFDAIAMGLPVILNFKGWIYELIKTNKIGVFQGDSPVDTIREMECLWHDTGAYKEMCRRSRELSEAEFTSEKAVADVCAIIFRVAIQETKAIVACSQTA
ncbi:putative glycosyltransferase protein [Lunatimonas lonarensis]|uniref:Putative glycosyltransferase protein n=1 Tax=Lunatimonas lonarensis TaxID=1232681 RepID=R7ZN75_9BACT|nr:glycosyltransferase family 4 protein [Lunatimonas lonarensis]EON75527.1 putative glycosyltransferase protein [Lunatimonas lonarensis]